LFPPFFSHQYHGLLVVKAQKATVDFLVIDGVGEVAEGN